MSTVQPEDQLVNADRFHITAFDPGEYTGCVSVSFWDMDWAEMTGRAQINAWDAIWLDHKNICGGSDLDFYRSMLSVVPYPTQPQRILVEDVVLSGQLNADKHKQLQAEARLRTVIQKEARHRATQNKHRGTMDKKMFKHVMTSPEDKNLPLVTTTVIWHRKKYADKGGIYKKLTGGLYRGATEVSDHIWDAYKHVFAYVLKKGFDISEIEIVIA